MVFVTANWWRPTPRTTGRLHRVDPTTIFPADAVGFCCDQIVQYVPSIDRFIWFLQGNGYRLAVASPQAHHQQRRNRVDLLEPDADHLRQPAGTGFDYPDLAVGNNELYMSWDAGAGCPPAARPVSRSPGRRSPGSRRAERSRSSSPTRPTARWPGAATSSQDTGDEIFWAGHNSNSQMRIFSLQEGSNTYFWRDRDVSSWANNAPDLADARQPGLARRRTQRPGGNSSRNAVIGATRAGNQVWFALERRHRQQLPAAAHRDRDARPRQQLQQDAAGADLEQQLRLRLPGVRRRTPAPARSACRSSSAAAATTRTTWSDSGATSSRASRPQQRRHDPLRRLRHDPAGAGTNDNPETSSTRSATA